jgi:hypothetical protein
LNGRLSRRRRGIQVKKAAYISLVGSWDWVSLVY